jgi:hypothetical protein
VEKSKTQSERVEKPTRPRPLTKLIDYAIVYLVRDKGMAGLRGKTQNSPADFIVTAAFAPIDETASKPSPAQAKSSQIKANKAKK